jgi:hypothetical protein
MTNETNVEQWVRQEAEAFADKHEKHICAWRHGMIQGYIAGRTAALSRQGDETEKGETWIAMQEFLKQELTEMCQRGFLWACQGRDLDYMEMMRDKFILDSKSTFRSKFPITSRTAEQKGEGEEMTPAHIIDAWRLVNSWTDGGRNFIDAPVTVQRELEKHLSVLQQQINDLKEQVKEKQESIEVHAKLAVERGARITALEAENKRLREGWVSVEDKPLVNKTKTGWVCTEDGDKDFIAAVPLSDGTWWIRHCRIADETGLCVVTDDDIEPAGWQITDITHYQPLPTPPAQTDNDKKEMV